MPFGRLYSDLHDHPKTRKARKGGDRPRDAAAIGLWVLANSWCIDNYQTDGWVPADELDRWDSDAERLAERLRVAGFWVAAERDGEDGWQFHDWGGHQKLAAEIDADREAARTRMQRVRSNGKRSTPARSEKVHDLEVEVEVEKKQPRKSAATAAAASADFDAFWNLYPRKIGKTAAGKAWEKALKATDVHTIAAGLRNAVAVWRATDTEPRFIPHPSTWLNEGRWDDEVELPNMPSATTRDLPPLPEPPPEVRDDPRATIEWQREQRRLQREQAGDDQ